MRPLARALLVAFATLTTSLRSASPAPPSVAANVSSRDGGDTRDATDAALARSSDATSAFDPARDGELRLHADDVADYTLRATLDDRAHTIRAEGTIRWRNASRVAVRELWLHLYLNAFKNERSAFLRERIGGRGSAPPEDWGFIDLRRLAIQSPDGGTVDLLPGVEYRRPGDDDETDARVALPRDVAPDERVEFEVAFDDKLPSIVERTGYRGRFHMVGQWFPKLARLEPDGTWAHFPFHHLSEFYADFGTYDITLDVPADDVVGATGPVVESRLAGGRRIERHVQSDVHDFAWTAWDRWNVESERVDGIEVRLLYPPGFSAVAHRELTAIAFALPYDARRYGPYPYTVLTVAHPQEDAGEAGGMEYPTFITTGGSWRTPPSVRIPEIVTVHELGHQWFYGIVATNEAAWPLLDEGVNQYAEADTMAHFRGPGSAVDLFGWTVDDAAVQGVASERSVHDEPVAQPAAAFTTGANYARLAYSRTAAVLETIGRVYGESALGAAMGLYTRRYRFEHPGPEQLFATLEQVIGRPAAEAARTAFFDEGWVDYTVDEVGSHRAASAGGVFDPPDLRRTVSREDASDWEGSVLVRRRGTLSFPVDIELTMTDGSIRRERWDGSGHYVRIPWSGPSALRAVAVDPDDHVLIDANPANNRATAPGEGRWAWRTLERVTYWMQLAIQAIAP